MVLFSNLSNYIAIFAFFSKDKWNINVPHWISNGWTVYNIGKVTEFI